MGPSSFTHRAALAVVLGVLVLTTLVRLRVADVPIERDEGEYAYAGQLILQGVPPYTQAYNMKFPGPYYAYAAVLAIFGPSAWGIHVGLALVNVATTVLLFLLARRLLGQPVAAAVAASLFALLSVDRFVLGVFAHATHFVLLAAIAGLLALSHALESRRPRTFVLAGVLLGVSVLMKQHAAVYVVLACARLFSRDRRDRRPLADTLRTTMLVGGGVLAPFAAIALLFAAQGALGQFWFWTFQYARAYITEVPLAMAWPVFRQTFGWVIQATIWIWLLAGAGALMLWIVRWPAETRAWLLGLALASLVAISPGFFFRSHYFILLLPAAALFAAAAVASVERLLATWAPKPVARAVALALAVAAGGAYAAAEWPYLTSMSAHDLSRSMYSVNPFLEAPDVGRYLREHTAPGDRIGLLGSEPEILFYAQRRAASGYIYTYPLFEAQPFAERMTEEWRRDLETVRPPYLVYAAISPSWTNGPAGNTGLIQWAAAYAHTCYDVVGIADIELTQTTTVWDAEAATYQPRGQNVLYTMKRKSPGPCAPR